MASIKADGDKLISYGDSIIALTNEYITEINNLFNSLSKLNRVAWVGQSANNYVSTLAIDKKRFIDFGDYLKMYGGVVRNTGVNINTIISKWDDN